MSFSSVALTDITPGTTGSFQDVDLDSFVTVPASATGALVVVLNDTASDLASGCRANGSTDNRVPVQESNSWRAHAVALDANHIIEVYVGASMNAYIAGFFGSESVFNTNAVAKSLTSTAAWVDIDISANTGADTATAAYFEANSVGGSRNYGFRKNGSTDSRVRAANKALAIIGVDASEICEGQINDTDMDFYLQGYAKSGVTFDTNATDKSIGSTAAYADADTLDSGKSHGVYEFDNTASTGNTWLRKKGATDDIYYRPGRDKQWMVIEGDASRVVEGKISATTCDWFRIGQFDAAAGGVSGTISATLAGATSSITGTTTVLGTMAALLANATSAITGTTTVTGTIAAVLQACTSAISATTTVLGSLAVTLANAVSAITGDAGAPPPATGNVLWWFRRRGRR